ncbi:PAS domain S-box protein [Hanamia caeni]|jgi:PAS domain S-box-containing protein|uniref:PAS domain S-box protein n=1 Tax=Hanamia caeni TaxID=2294116 RepID=A0A3M9N8Q6_9BACT|nr:PAS domain S-box protein [Hanamia caeni]RNI34184.1 PAS domain S-box protein [Hanamia caeni]
MNNLNYLMPRPIVKLHATQLHIQSPTPESFKNPDLISPEQLYDAVYESAFHPMFVGDFNGNIIKFNEKFSSLFGYAPSEIEKIKADDFFKSMDSSFITFIDEMNEKGIARAEVRGIKKSREIFPCRISSVLYQSDKGERRFMNTVVNISEHISARWNLNG